MKPLLYERIPNDVAAFPAAFPRCQRHFSYVRCGARGEPSSALPAKDAKVSGELARRPLDIGKSASLRIEFSGVVIRNTFGVDYTVRWIFRSYIHV